MGLVMLDTMDLRPEGPGPRAHACSQVRPEVAHLERVPDAVSDRGEGRSIREREAQLAGEMGSRITIDRDRVHSIGWNVGRPEAEANRFQGEAGPVLDSNEPLLLGSCPQRAVHDEAGGGIAVIRVDA